MRKTLIFSVLAFCWVLALNAQQIQNRWITSAGSTGWDVAADIAISPGDGVYIFGAFYDSISFNDKKLYSEGSRDLFLARYNSKGNYQNAFSFGGSGFDYPIKIKSIGKRNLVVAFKHIQSVKIAGKVIPGEYTNTYSIAWLNSENTLSNYFSIGASGKSGLTDLAIARDSCIWVCGWFEDTLHASGKIYVAQSKEDIYLARFSKSGTLLWLNQFGGEGSDKAQVLCARSDSAMCISGTTAFGCFGKRFAPDTDRKSGEYLFLAEASPAGKISKISYPASGDDILPSGIVQTDSAIWIATSFSGTARVNNKKVECKGKRNILLLWNEKSAANWDYQHWEGDMVDIPVSFNKLRNGLILTGLFSGKINFSGYETDSTAGGTDVFLIHISQTGKINKIFILKGKGFNFPSAVAIKGHYIYVAGEFMGDVENEAGSLKSNGKEDVFLAQYIDCYLTKNVAVNIDINQLGGTTYYDLSAEKGYDSYKWNNSENTTPYFSTTLAGTYTIEVTDTLGCPYSNNLKVSTASEKQQVNTALSGTKFRIYPTMTSNSVYWEPDSSWDLDSPVSVTIFNGSGSEISSRSIESSNQGSNAIDFSNCANGVYFVKISGSNFNQESKIIVRR